MAAYGATGHGPADRQRVDPSIQFFSWVPDSRADLKVARTAPLESPSAQACQADPEPIRDLRFGQKYSCHTDAPLACWLVHDRSSSRCWRNPSIAAERRKDC